MTKRPVLISAIVALVFFLAFQAFAFVPEFYTGGLFALPIAIALFFSNRALLRGASPKKQLLLLNLNVLVILVMVAVQWRAMPLFAR